MRISTSARLFLTRSEQAVYIHLIENQHDSAYRDILRLVGRLIEDDHCEEQEEDVVPSSCPPIGDRYYEWCGLPPNQFYSELDKFLALDEHQENLLRTSDANIALSGGPGTGKTVLAMNRAVTLARRDHCTVYFMTWSEGLRSLCSTHARISMGLNECPPNLVLKSFEKFIEEDVAYGSPLTYDITQHESRTALRDLVRTLRLQPLEGWSAEKLWRNIRGFILERPPGDHVPASKSHKRDGVLDDLRRLAEEYVKHKNGRADWSDYLRNLLSLVKQSRLTRRPHAYALVIDEVQDFTEIELSLLLAWHESALNGQTPVWITGDVGQQLHHSSFSWKDLRQLLPDLRLERLTQVYRNGRFIYDLAGVFRNLLRGDEYKTSPPNVPGCKPILAIGGAHDFWHAFLARDKGPRYANVAVISESDARDREIGLSLSPAEAKGLEFDYAIAVGFLSELPTQGLRQHQVQLWHMTVTRARRHLLLVVTEESYRAAVQLVPDLLATVDIVDTLERAIEEFMEVVDDEVCADVGVYFKIGKARSVRRKFDETGDPRFALQAAVLFEGLQHIEEAAKSYVDAGNAELDQHNRLKHFEKAVSWFERHDRASAGSVLIDHVLPLSTDPESTLERAIHNFKTAGLLAQKERAQVLLAEYLIGKGVRSHLSTESKRALDLLTEARAYTKLMETWVQFAIHSRDSGDTKGELLAYEAAADIARKNLPHSSLTPLLSKVATLTREKNPHRCVLALIELAEAESEEAATHIDTAETIVKHTRNRQAAEVLERHLLQQAESSSAQEAEHIRERARGLMQHLEQRWTDKVPSAQDLRPTRPVRQAPPPSILTRDVVPPKQSQSIPQAREANRSSRNAVDEGPKKHIIPLPGRSSAGLFSARPDFSQHTQTPPNTPRVAPPNPEPTRPSPPALPPRAAADVDSEFVRRIHDMSRVHRFDNESKHLEISNTLLTCIEDARALLITTRRRPRGSRAKRDQAMQQAQIRRDLERGIREISLWFTKGGIASVPRETMERRRMWLHCLYSVLGGDVMAMVQRRATGEQALRMVESAIRNNLR